MMNGIARDVTGHLIDITAAGVKIPVEAREVECSSSNLVGGRAHSAA
jgi:hypothetical protein